MIFCTVGLGAYLIAAIALLQMQWHRLRCADTDTALTTGLARTVLDLLTKCRDRAEVARAIEKSRFRSIRVSAFDGAGDVLLDSAEPTTTGQSELRATPPSTRQMELFRAVQQHAKAGEASAGGVTLGSIYRPCAIGGDPQLTSFASVRSDDPPLVVVATACGHEG